MKLPIGIQTFSEIREGGFLYVDKTEHIHRIITSGKYYFLARPRRFGKSLLLSTIHELYEGNKRLFSGLWIEDQWNWNDKHPVIHLKFSSQGLKTLGIEKAIFEMLREESTRLNIRLEKQEYDLQLRELIEKAGKNSKVVLLIDEYDKPIIDFLDDLDQARENRQVLKNFYSVLKDSDPFLELVFMTGVSRFAKTSIFSDLNNLSNLTMHRKAWILLGLTQEEVDLYFEFNVQELAAESGMTLNELKAQIRQWYNGYSWNGRDKVYNPFSVLSYFEARQFDNFWFETGTPTFLLKTLRENWDYNIEKMEVSASVLDNYDLEFLNPITILFQTGYLTIEKELAQGIYTLVYPNKEVRLSMEEKLLTSFSHDSRGSGRAHAYHLSNALRKGSVEDLVKILNAIFSSIPAELWQKENEAFYHALIHLTFSLMGAYIQSEIHSSNGRLDAKVETNDTVYILEFKPDRSAEEAIRQIEEKGYFKPYLTADKKVVGIGINFSKEKKAVENWMVKVF